MNAKQRIDERWIMELLGKNNPKKGAEDVTAETTADAASTATGRKSNGDVPLGCLG
jgi:hypothetical protein